jgi:hypothetical protein
VHTFAKLVNGGTLGNLPDLAEEKIREATCQPLPRARSRCGAPYRAHCGPESSLTCVEYDLTARALAEHPDAKQFSGRVSDSGEGRWIASAALERSAPRPVLTWSWTQPRRVVAKVEYHVGELFPRGGLIVTNLHLPNRAVVRFYNKRGSAEQ